MAEEISLPTHDDLPARVTPPTAGTLTVCMTYKRVLGYFKNGKDTVAIYGGAVAEYKRENDFQLDRTSLLKSV